LNKRKKRRREKTEKRVHIIKYFEYKEERTLVRETLEIMTKQEKEIWIKNIQENAGRSQRRRERRKTNN
jgi:hypothetical protein